ncbi:MAG TPA: efflux transporter outer membrane subunit [Steroidobacteraceae bacterium]
MKAQLLILTAFGLTACASFGPDRKAPKMPEPDHYSVEAQQAQLPNADGVGQTVAAGVTPVPDWWRAYESEELNRLIEEGLKMSPSLAAAQSNLKAAREQLRGQIGKTMAPSVDATFTPGRVREPAIPIVPHAQPFESDIFSADISASYSLDIFGANRLANSALAGKVQQQAFELEATRRTLAANIVMATINASALQEQVTATEQLVEMGEERARQAAGHYNLGSASRDEMLSAEQDGANAAATLPALRARALAVRHAQAVLLGRTPDRAPTPMALESLHLPDSVPFSLPSELLHQRPDILAAEAAVRAAADQAGSAQAAMFPSLTLSAAYGRSGFDWSALSSPASAVWGVGGALTQPLFHGGALRARKRQYQATYEAAVSQYKQTVLSAFKNVADTLVALDEDANTVTQTERAESAAREAKTNSESRYKLGSTPFYATLTAGQQFESAHVQTILARAGRLADTAALLDSMGDPQIAKTALALKGPGEGK